MAEEGGNAEQTAVEAAMATEVRVVRCPKCKKLLPELVGFKVYRCGGCNAALQANKSASVAVTTMDASSPDKPVTITESQLPPLRDDHGGRDRFSGNNWTTQQHNRRRHPSRPIDATDFRNEVEVEEEDDEEERTSTGPWRTSNSSSSYGARFAPYSDEGTSNLRQSLRSSSMYTHGSNLSELPERVEHLEQDRAELLKKLDELRDQLSRSCELGGNGANADQKVRTKTHHRENHSLNDWFHEQPPLPPPPPPPPPPPAVRHFPPNNYHHYHSAMQSHGDFLGGYRDPFAPVPVRRMSNQLRQLPVPVNSYVNCNNGFYDPDSIAPSYPVDTFHHQHNHHPNHIPSRIPPVTFGNRRRTPQFTTCNDCFPVGDAAIGVGGDDAVDDLNYNRRSEASYLAQEPLIRRRPITKQQNNGRWCRPVSGGAPFIVCSNCYQLMQVPPRLLLRDKDRHKLRCGACSHLIFFEVDGNNLIVSNPCSTNMVGGVSDGGGNVSSEHRNEPHTYPDSGDYLHSGDEKFVLSSPPFNMTQEAMDMEGRRVIDSIIYLRDDNSRSAELGTHHKPDGNSRSRVMASTPLREHFGCSSFNHGAGTRSEAGSRSARSEQEKVVSGNATFKQNSVKDVLMATEMDFPADESPNPDMSLDSPPGSCEEELPRSSKGGGGESFLTGLIKKGFRDLSRSNQLSENGKSKVSVNGHRISYRSVKKAEKHAGPIQPGEYWYDYRAGFWGVIGKPGLGIIPPFIEEFNYPIPKNCSDGDTGVIVNGRELHRKDLELLGRRGLPTSRDGSFIIEISGRVLNAVTGEELDCLGKLAPTVEKVKHGFGMRVPGVAATASI